MAATFAECKLAAAAVDTEQAAAVDNNTNNFDTTLTRLNIVAFICYYMIQLKELEALRHSKGQAERL